MSQRCSLCNSTSLNLIYDSGEGVSVTSMSEIHPGRTTVYYCRACCHVQTEGILGVENYYADGYNINITHEDEDQLYEVQGDRKIYRTEHQLKVISSKVALNSTMSVLDYGCAKSSMGKKFLELFPELSLCFFDVSAAYQSYWDKMVPRENCAVCETPEEWLGKFDLVTSFFSMEHIPDIRAALNHIASLLNDEGQLYAIVPDVLGNIADLIVIDHVHHFTVESLTYVLRNVGFEKIEIDRDAHRGALVVNATKGAVNTVEPKASQDVENEIKQLGLYWSGYAKRVRQAEASVNGDLAIFGAGFYGMFSYVCLVQRERVRMFLDNNPFLQSKTISNIPVVSPTSIAGNIAGVLIGLNPAIARRVIAQLPAEVVQGRHLFFFD